MFCINSRSILCHRWVRRHLIAYGAMPSTDAMLIKNHMLICSMDFNVARVRLQKYDFPKYRRTLCVNLAWTISHAEQNQYVPLSVRVILGQFFCCVCKSRPTLKWQGSILLVVLHCISNLMAVSFSFHLTHLTLVPHICASESGPHWFR